MFFFYPQSTRWIAECSSYNGPRVQQHAEWVPRLYWYTCLITDEATLSICCKLSCRPVAHGEFKSPALTDRTNIHFVSTTGIKRAFSLRFQWACCDFRMPAEACTRACTVPLQHSRVRPFFVCLGASRSGLKDSGAAAGCKDSIQAKRVQVFDTWSEIQQLEEEIEKKMVSADATKATEKHIRRQGAGRWVGHHCSSPGSACIKCSS